MRAFCFVVRAGAERRSQSSSRRRRFCRLLLGARLERVALRLLLEVRLVAALVEVQRPPGELGGALHHAVEEEAIVRDQEQRARLLVASGAPRATRWCRRRGGWSARRGSRGPGRDTEQAREIHAAPLAAAHRRDALPHRPSTPTRPSIASARCVRSQPPSRSIVAAASACAASQRSTSSPSRERLAGLVVRALRVGPRRQPPERRVERRSGRPRSSAPAAGSPRGSRAAARPRPRPAPRPRPGSARGCSCPTRGDPTSPTRSPAVSVSVDAVEHDAGAVGALRRALGIEERHGSREHARW